MLLKVVRPLEWAHFWKTKQNRVRGKDGAETTALRRLPGYTGKRFQLADDKIDLFHRSQPRIIMIDCYKS